MYILAQVHRYPFMYVLTYAEKCTSSNTPPSAMCKHNQSQREKSPMYTNTPAHTDKCTHTSLLTLLDIHTPQQVYTQRQTRTRAHTSQLLQAQVETLAELFGWWAPATAGSQTKRGSRGSKRGCKCLDCFLLKHPR